MGYYRYVVEIPLKDNTGKVTDVDRSFFSHLPDAEYYIRGRLYILPDDTIATLTDRYSHRDKLRVTAYRYSAESHGVIIAPEYCN